MIYKTITTEVEVDVHLSDFDTDDLVEELEGRGREAMSLSFDDNETLTKIWLHDREGRKEEAYELMRWYVLEKLGKVV
jgi:hypothetical protein